MPPAKTLMARAAPVTRVAAMARAIELLSLMGIRASHWRKIAVRPR